MSEKEIGYVYESSASGISVKMDFETFEKNKKLSYRKFLDNKYW